MKIGLIDVDGHNFPNLALMKISGYYKAKLGVGKIERANRAWLFKPMDFEDFEPRKGFKCKQYLK